MRETWLVELNRLVVKANCLRELALLAHPVGQLAFSFEASEASQSAGM